MYKSMLAVIAVLLLSGTTFSEGVKQCFSCKSGYGSDLVCQGASTFEVTQKCGAPDHSETRDKIISGGTGDNIVATYIQIETYYYNCGEGRFIKILEFNDGELSSISNGDKGS